jgi:DNA adenine methylase
MKPLFKWTGGKRREIPQFEELFPQYVKDKEDYLYIEPFVGGGAVLFHLENSRNIINDLDLEVSNFYQSVKRNSTHFSTQLKSIEGLYPSLSDEQRGELYYKYRCMDRPPGLLSMSSDERAIRFYVVTSLAFAGMRRFNSEGYFNIPFGHYKTLSLARATSPKVVDLIGHTTIDSEDFEGIITANDLPNTFMFLDPPYTRVFKEYSSKKEFTEEDHKRLADCVKKAKAANIMLVIDKSDITSKLYTGLIRKTYTVGYSVNIRNRFSNRAEHYVITNY